MRIRLDECPLWVNFSRCFVMISNGAIGAILPLGAIQVPPHLCTQWGVANL